MRRKNTRIYTRYKFLCFMMGSCYYGSPWQHAKIAHPRERFSEPIIPPKHALRGGAQTTKAVALEISRRYLSIEKSLGVCAFTDVEKGKIGNSFEGVIFFFCNTCDTVRVYGLIRQQLLFRHERVGEFRRSWK